MVHTTTCHTRIIPNRTRLPPPHPKKLSKTCKILFGRTYSIPNPPRNPVQNRRDSITRNEKMVYRLLNRSAKHTRISNSSYHHPPPTKVLPSWKPILKELPWEDNHFGRGPGIPNPYKIHNVVPRTWKSTLKPSFIFKNQIGGFNRK
jgi:hypothetical protein